MRQVLPAARSGSYAPLIVSLAYGLAVAAALGHFLLGLPIQVTDSFGNMLKLETSWRELLAGEFTQRAYLRPFLWAQLKLVYDAADGNFYPWFRGVHVAQVFALVLLFVTLARPRTWRDAAVVPLALAALIGSHTFKGTVVEAFPINTFMTVLLCCLAAANLAMMRHRWWVDLLAIALFVIAALTVESGLLVGVIFLGAALVGARGLSRPAIATVAILFGAYFVLRFAILDVGAPALIERASGYGFRTLEPSQLIERFGDAPGWFYAYNVASSILSVLFSEPRGGVFRLVYGMTVHDPEPSAILNVVASTAGTALIAAFAWRRRHAWIAREFSRDDQLVLLFGMVLLANAAISYPYTKDVIISPAGVFYAVALYAAVRALVAEAASARPSHALASIALCGALAVSWGVRAVGLHLNVRESARKVRAEWAYVDDWLEREGIHLTGDRERALLRHLREDALYRHPPPPYLPISDNEWFDVD